MANQELLNLLKHGVAEWNQWRKEHLETYPDLIGADLKGANLKGADLKGANLKGANLRQANLRQAKLLAAKLFTADLFTSDLNGANLSRANLSRADLSRANLIGADLSRADLSRADLSRADLSRANLDEAILRYANLSGADLSRANLDGADLSRATFWDTILTDLDLRTTKGLMEIHHAGPSIVQLHSILLPQDGNTLHFLRKVGTPDEWIDFYRTSMIHPIQYHSCFISYASDNEEIAKRLHADLQANGVRCWFAPHDLKPGDYFREEIDKAIHMQDKLLLILSEQSVASKWVRYEVNRALDREVNQERTILFPIRIDDSALHSKGDWAASLRSSRHIGNFTHWQEHQGYQEAFTQLLKHLKDETK